MSQLVLGDLPRAAELAARARECASDTDAEEAATALIVSGDIDVAWRSPDLPHFYDMAFKVLLAAPGDHSTARTWRDLGNRYQALNMLDRAIVCYQRSLDMARVRAFSSTVLDTVVRKAGANPIITLPAQS